MWSPYNCPTDPPPNSKILQEGKKRTTKRKMRKALVQDCPRAFEIKRTKEHAESHRFWYMIK